MTEPITHDEVIQVALAMSGSAARVLRSTHSAAEGFDGEADLLRATADWLEVFGQVNTPDILRRAADQVDPPEPTEPDLTTP